MLILGHSTGIGEKKESVELYSYAEFDAWDQKDCFRLTGIRSRWNNSDMAALGIRRGCGLEKELRDRLYFCYFG